jgi:hypothetical protein
VKKNIDSKSSATLQEEKKFSGPSEQEKKEADSNKDNVINRQNLDNIDSDSESSGRRNVSPVITNASQIDKTISISAYVADIFEAGGTCTATIVLGNDSIIKKSKANPGATTTDCEPIRVSRSEFNKAGDWSATIEYLSSNASGKSLPVVVRVQ